MSTTRTPMPSARSASTMWEPMNPAPPVTRTVIAVPCRSSPPHHADRVPVAWAGNAEFIVSLAPEGNEVPLRPIQLHGA